MDQSVTDLQGNFLKIDEIIADKLFFEKNIHINIYQLTIFFSQSWSLLFKFTFDII